MTPENPDSLTFIPHVTRVEDGSLHLHWPESEAPTTTISREVLIDMVAQLNGLNIYKQFAELVWEELTEWHYDTCPIVNGESSPCDCRSILQKMWNDITNAEQDNAR